MDKVKDVITNTIDCFNEILTDIDEFKKMPEEKWIAAGILVIVIAVPVFRCLFVYLNQTGVKRFFMNEADRKKQDYISTIIMLSAFLLVNLYITKQKEINLLVCFFLMVFFFIIAFIIKIINRISRKDVNSRKDAKEINMFDFFAFTMLFSSAIQAVAYRISSKPVIIFIVCLGSIVECLLLMLSTDLLNQDISFIDIEINGKYYPYFYRHKEFIICGSELENSGQQMNDNCEDNGDIEYKLINDPLPIENVREFCIFKYEPFIKKSEDKAEPCIRIRPRKVKVKKIQYIKIQNKDNREK